MIKVILLSLIVIPEKYPGHDNPGAHLKRIIQNTNPNVPICLFTYTEPDTSPTSPFSDKINCIHQISLDQQENTSTKRISQRTETQWGHVREGSTDPHAFFKYLKVAKQFSISDKLQLSFMIPKNIEKAISKISPGSDVYNISI